MKKVVFFDLFNSLLNSGLIVHFWGSVRLTRTRGFAVFLLDLWICFVFLGMFILMIGFFVENNINKSEDIQLFFTSALIKAWTFVF